MNKARRDSCASVLSTTLTKLMMAVVFHHLGRATDRPGGLSHNACPTTHVASGGPKQVRLSVPPCLVREQQLAHFYAAATQEGSCSLKRSVFFRQDYRCRETRRHGGGADQGSARTPDQSQGQAERHHLRPEFRGCATAGIDRQNQRQRRVQGYQSDWLPISRAGRAEASRARGGLRYGDGEIGVLAEPVPDFEAALRCDLTTSWRTHSCEPRCAPLSSWENNVGLGQNCLPHQGRIAKMLIALRRFQIPAHHPRL